jgi:uncharacterized protein (TIGR03067 family)
LRATRPSSRKENRQDKATFRLDPSRTAKRIDFTREDGKVMLGIYRLEADVLKICLGKAGAKERPQGFATEGTENQLLILRRAKP